MYISISDSLSLFYLLLFLSLSRSLFLSHIYFSFIEVHPNKQTYLLSGIYVQCPYSVQYINVKNSPILKKKSSKSYTFKMFGGKFVPKRQIF